MGQKNIKNKWHQSQRGYFAGSLYQAMQDNPNVFCLTGDLGFGMLDQIKKDYPQRFINTGAAEQALLGLAVGLALEGKIPFVYTISSFYMRAMETINLYLHKEGVAIQMIGSGRDNDYKHDGYSHDATMFQNMLKLLNVDQYYPETKEVIPAMVKMMIKNKKPSFISLRR